MPLPLVIAHHLLSTAYGWWLPNDVRGSDSTCIASDVIAELGELHHGRKRVQPTGKEIRAFYAEAKKLLRHPLPVQNWWFVTPYDGWPFHPGHNPSSPYARRLRGQ
jgi:hypothetical protein